MAKVKVDSLMMNELVDIMGLPINSPEVMAFLETNGIKYPKKDTISNKANSRDFWVVAKKLGIDLSFGVEVHNSKYAIGQAHRKDIFVPILTCILFQGKASVNYPSGIHYDADVPELISKIGKPTHSVTARRYSYHLWDLPLDQQKDIIFRLHYNMEHDQVNQMSIQIKEAIPLIELYDTLTGRTINDKVLTKNSYYTKCDFFFINWALENNLLSFPPSAQDSLDQFRSRKINIVEFIEANFANKSYIAQEDFVNIDPQFLSDYYDNLSGYDISYSRDFEFAFLKDETLRSNSLGKEALAEMAKVDYTPESLGLIAEIIDQRYKEYTAHQFAQSAKILL